MTRMREGLLCPKCGIVVPAKPEASLRKEKKRNDFDYIYVSGASTDNYLEILRQCPRCGNKKAVLSVSSIYGEHAGTGRERTMKHFRCTKCSYSWTEES
jgi:DNA-directed RNA polymerase subunit M/transcription elongation factor TFIIS